MADTIPSSGDRTVVIHRFGPLTWISLAFNALILLLILIGFIAHHHHKTPTRDGGWGGPCHWQNRGSQGPGDFHRHDWGTMRPSWHHGFNGGPREDERGPRMEDRPGWNDGAGPEWGGARADDFHGPARGPLAPPSAEAMTDRFMLMMTDKLALTDPESAKIRPIVQDQITQFQKDAEAQKAAHQKMIEDAKAKIRPILTPEQQKQFDQLTAGLGAPPVPPPDKSAGE